MKKNTKRKLYKLPLKPCKTFVAYLLMLPLSFIFTQALRNSASAVMFFFIAALPLADYIYLIISLLTVRFEFEIGETRVTRLRQVSVKIIKKNYSPLPVPFAYVQLSLPAGMKCDTERVHFSLSPFERRVICQDVRFTHRGIYRVGIDGVFVKSLMGFFRISLNYREMQSVEVIPRRLDINAHMVHVGGGGGVTVSDEGEDPAGVRDYRPGDSMRKIHWKLSAKGEELLVKQYDGDGDKDTVIVGDMYAENDEDAYKTEAVCEVMLGLCRKICEQERQIRVYTGTELLCVSSPEGSHKIYGEICAMSPEKKDTYSADGAIYVTADPKGLMGRLSEATEPAGILCVMHGRISDEDQMYISRLKQTDMYIWVTDENGGEISL